ncbi:hypothetical protein [Agromyces marinus]|uniref:hypothetical protein n=1 Tax=Agromyces marinus TaxID=1389020 RepID=UPI0025745A54|nr:hypothetical protein [Agromyces marinus]
MVVARGQEHGANGVAFAPGVAGETRSAREPSSEYVRKSVKSSGPIRIAGPSSSGPSGSASRTVSTVTSFAAPPIGLGSSSADAATGVISPSSPSSATADASSAGRVTATEAGAAARSASAVIVTSGSGPSSIAGP